MRLGYVICVTACMYGKHVGLSERERDRERERDLEIPGITAASVCLAPGFQTVSARAV